MKNQKYLDETIQLSKQKFFLMKQKMLEKLEEIDSFTKNGKK